MTDFEIVAACARFLGLGDFQDSSVWAGSIPLSSGQMFAPLTNPADFRALLVRAAELGLGPILEHGNPDEDGWHCCLTAYASHANADPLRAVAVAVARWQTKKEARDAV